jgi:ferredoxin--NADP+ reductase
MSDTTAIPGIPDLREVRMHLHTPADPGTGVVVSSRRVTAGRKSSGYVRHVAIDVSGTRLAGQFVAGQSFGVIPPGVDARGVAHKVRLYSIASPSAGEDGEGRVIATTVKRLIDEHEGTGKLFLGVASNYLCDLREGDQVRVTGPAGKRFVLPGDPSAHDYVFFATGTGIAPFRGMLMDLFRRPGQGGPAAGSRAVLVMGTPYATDLLYHDEMQALAADHPGFRYLTAVSREAQETRRGRRPMYVQDQIGESEELRALLASPRTLVYICGIAGMELGILRGLSSELSGDAREQYVQADPAVADPASWDRRMIHKQVRPTRRVFMEVY